MALVTLIHVARWEKWEREGERHAAHVPGSGIEPQTATLRAVASAYGTPALHLCPKVKTPSGLQLLVSQDLNHQTTQEEEN